jgi:hypothetical protein
VGNVAKVVALDLGIYNLTLPSEMLLELDNCYFVPVLARNIVSISYLVLNGFKFIIENKCCSFYNNNVYYKSGNYTNGLYVFDLEILIFNINIKRNKLNNLYPSYLWHYRLGHINEIKITKLYKEGYFDHESYSSCKSYLLGKMTKTSFIEKSKRSKELLGLIYTNVCGLIKICVICGYTCFIAFTDDHSRYSYMYLMKYKSASFERFKEFRMK